MSLTAIAYAPRREFSGRRRARVLLVERTPLMDKNQARAIVDGRIAELRKLTYADLQRFLEPEDQEIAVDSSHVYQVETKAVWDDRKGGNLRVFVLIDDGGWRAFAPLSSEFIISPEGSFIDE